MATNGGAPVTQNTVIAELAFRLGVPTFVLVVLLVLLGPKIDHGIAVADRVDGELSIIAASCFAAGPPPRGGVGLERGQLQPSGPSD